MTSKEYGTYNNCCCNASTSSCVKKFAQEKPILTTGLVLGSTLAIASLVSPTIRKVTVPTCKFVAKQQLKILAGIGLLSITTLISSSDDFIDDKVIDNDVIYLD